MTRVVGVLVPAFSLREQEPNPCNVRLAEEALRICYELIDADILPLLVVQWEVELALNDMGKFREYGKIRLPRAQNRGIVPYGGAIGQAESGEYLGTKEVVDQAIEIFRERECDSVIVVANPFIHKQYTSWLVQRAGMKVTPRSVRWIGFDKESTQWWCRSWWQFLWQTVRLALGIEHGFKGRQAPQS